MDSIQFSNFLKLKDLNKSLEKQKIPAKRIAGIVIYLSFKIKLHRNYLHLKLPFFLKFYPKDTSSLSKIVVN